MNILFVASDKIPHVGGKSTHICDLRDGLKYYEHKAEIISAANFPKKANLLLKLLLSPFWLFNRSFYAEIYNKFYKVIMTNLITDYCYKNQVDIISAQDVYAAKMCEKVVRKSNTPMILTMHTYFAIERTLDNRNVGVGLQKLEKLLLDEMLALDISKAVVAVDNRIKQHVIDCIVERKKNLEVSVECIPNFTNIQRFKPVSLNKKNELRDKYGINHDRFIIVCARRLVEKNGVIYAVRAIKKLSRDSKVTLLIVGDGPQREAITDYISSNSLQDKVILFGEIENNNMHEIYQLADASIVPSITVNGLQEATSVSAIESMACGLPVIASSIGGLKELIKDKYNGCLIPETDYDAIASYIDLLEKDKVFYENVSQHATEYIKEKHSHIGAGKQYFEVFNKFTK